MTVWSFRHPFDVGNLILLLQYCIYFYSKVLNKIIISYLYIYLSYNALCILDLTDSK